MANKINPGSIHLGGDYPQFFAEYLPQNVQAQDPSCILPPAVPLNLTPTTLVGLNESCVFQFPDITPIPPGYTPPTLKFTACENLVARTSITTCPATKNSKLTLISSGPIAGADGGPGQCSITLDGNLCIDACETFKATSNIIFDNATKRSSIKVVSKSSPECGLDLIGNIHVDACEDFTVTNNLKFDKASKNSILNLKARTSPHCGLDLSGTISVIACETFDASVDIRVVDAEGGNMVTRNNWAVVPKSTPDCGFKLTGDVALAACSDFSASSNIKLLGPHWKSGSSFSVTPTKRPNCGLALAGELALKACSDFTATSSVTFSGRARPKGTIKVTSTPEPNCKLDLSGDIVIDACTEFILEEIVSTGGIITFYNKEKLLTQIDLAPRVYISSGLDDCSKKISIDLASPSVNLALLVSEIMAEVSAMLKGLGGGGSSTAIYSKCYDCGRVPGCETHLSLNLLEVNHIKPPPYPCCVNGGANYIDMCAGDMTMTGKVKFGTQNNLAISDDGLTLWNDSLISREGWTFKTVAISDCSIILGKTNINCEYISIGNVSINADSMEFLGSTTSITSTTISLGETQLESGSISVGTNTAITDGEISVSGISLGSNGLDTGEVKIEPSRITVGNVQIADNTLSVGQISMSDDILVIGSGNNTVTISPPDSKQASFQQVSFCVNGEQKTAYVLMTTPT